MTPREDPRHADVSAVVVSWNSARFLDGCLRSLFAQQGVSVEVVVVDNGSSDGSIELVRRNHPRARLIELGVNRGFCAANNAGLAAASGASVLFANADLVLAENYLEEALRPFASDERTGLVGGKLLRFDHATVDSAGQFLTRSRRIVERGYGEPDGPWSETPGYVFSICGAAMLCRRDMIEDISVGGELFDEVYFAFSEDLDVGWRARLGGWRAWYAPRAVAYHYRGGSEAEEGSRRRLPAFLRRPRSLRFHILKNRWLTILKNDSIGDVLRDAPFILARDLALVGAATVTAPGLLLDVVRARALAREALLKRRAYLGRTGRWRTRRPGAPRSWVRWSAPLPTEPDGPA